MDIVERLRSPEVFLSNGLYSPVAYEAADEIERLREALQIIANHDEHWMEGAGTECRAIARSALQQKDSE